MKCRQREEGVQNPIMVTGMSFVDGSLGNESIPTQVVLPQGDVPGQVPGQERGVLPLRRRPRDSLLPRRRLRRAARHRSGTVCI